jgi:hypothetical protein
MCFRSGAGARVYERYHKQTLLSLLARFARMEMDTLLMRFVMGGGGVWGWG